MYLTTKNQTVLDAHGKILFLGLKDFIEKIVDGDRGNSSIYYAKASLFQKVDRCIREYGVTEQATAPTGFFRFFKLGG